VQAYDEHLNMVLGDVEETVTTTEVDEETAETIVKVRRGVAVIVTVMLARRRGGDSAHS
jgi:small nuclear ribonucleoprotein (snRNP)-like protein